LTTRYDLEHFNPPAPVVQVTLRNPESGKMVSDIPLLLDTGADVTLLPRAMVVSIGVSILADQQYELVGFNGNKSSSNVVILDMIFLKRVFRGRYLLIEEEYGILGRDIINHVVILLDGPKQQWSEYTP